MGSDAWVMLIILAVMVYLLVRDILPATVVFLGALTTTLVLGLNEVDVAFAGFSNQAIITIAALFVIARAASKTGLILPLTNRLLKHRDGWQSRQFRLLGSVATLSGFTNNTPIVAMLVPQISKWSKRHQESLSQYLMPLSFAAILGGTLTLMGTSTTIVVSGLLGQLGFEQFSFFEITKVSLPIVILGLFFLVFFSRKLLPIRRSAQQELDEDIRQFVIDMKVSGKLDGKTVTDAGLRNLEQVFLTEIERENDVISPVGSDTKLRKGDILRFAGKADDVLDLRRIDGIDPTEQKHVQKLDTKQSTYFEAVVGMNSPLSGKTLKEVNFRGIYQAAVVAIHRAGHIIDAKPGSVRLHPGDTLILVSDAYFKNRWENRQDFLIVYQLDSPISENKTRQVAMLGAILLAVVAVAGSGFLPLVVAVLFGAFAIVASGIMTIDDARQAMDFELLILIATAFGVAEAVSTTGLAEAIASAVIYTLGAFGVIGVLLGVIITTIVLTELLTNTAAALLVLPIAISAAESVSVDPRGFAIAVAIAASASFMTPIGYQTNTMVYGPGGYQFTDYARLGFPLTILVVVLVSTLVPIFYF